MSAVCTQPAAASWPLRRIRLVQRLSRVQDGQAELHRGEVSGLQDRRPGGEEGAARQHLLWLLELSQVQVHIGVQAACGTLSGMRQSIPDREDAQVGYVHRLSQ